MMRSVGNVSGISLGSHVSMQARATSHPELTVGPHQSGCCPTPRDRAGVSAQQALPHKGGSAQGRQPRTGLVK